MKKIKLFLIVFLLLHGYSPAQPSDHAKENPSAIANELTVHGMQSDFDILRKALEEAHGGLYRFSDKQSLDRRMADYRKKLNHTMNRLQFIGILSEMLAEIKDGHTRLEYDSATITALSRARMFPLSVLIEGKQLMVLYNDTPGDSTIRPGMEIISINGRKAGDLLQSILPKIPGDGYIETGKRGRLERNFASNYWLFADQSASFSITTKDKTGKIITTTLEGVLASERKTNRNVNKVNLHISENMSKLFDRKQNIVLDFVKGPGIAAVHIRSFSGDDFKSTIDSVFLKIQENKTKVLILDLRGNGGGADMYGAFLVSQFTDKPFRYFDRIHIATILPSFATWKPHTSENLKNGTVPDPSGGYLVTAKLHNGVAEQQPSTHPFLGKLIVLTDGGTFSTAADASAILRNSTQASFVGEESGGAYEGNISGLNAQIMLPNSALGLKIQMYGYWNAVSPRQKGRGVLPDYPAERRISDLIEGIDAQWNKAVELALETQRTQ